LKSTQKGTRKKKKKNSLEKEGNCETGSVSGEEKGLFPGKKNDQPRKHSNSQKGRKKKGQRKGRASQKGKNGFHGSPAWGIGDEKPSRGAVRGVQKKKARKNRTWVGFAGRKWVSGRGKGKKRGGIKKRGGRETSKGGVCNLIKNVSGRAGA